MEKQIDVLSCLCDTPKPYYLIDKAIITYQDNQCIFWGKVMFPISDPAVAAMGDHVNIAQSTTALSNAMRIIGKEVLDCQHFRVSRMMGNYKKTILPNNVYDLFIKILKNDISSKGKRMIIDELPAIAQATNCIHGSMNATFSFKEEIITQVECKFVGY